MIELKHISARILIPYNAHELNQLLEKTGAASAEDVLKLIEEYPEYDWYEAVQNLDYVKRKMELYNEKGYQPECYHTKGYSSEDLSRQDLINHGSILLLNNPTNFRVRYIMLEPRTIASIKQDLAHTFASGRNIVSGSYRKVSDGSIPKIISSIEMYEQQIERQALLTSARDINLFELHKKEKLDIVEEMYNEIIMYLVYNADEKLVWSDLSDAQKKLYISSAINTKAADVETKQKIKEYIAGYTTLPELEKLSKHNLKVLKRFILK